MPIAVSPLWKISKISSLHDADRVCVCSHGLSFRLVLIEFRGGISFSTRYKDDSNGFHPTHEVRLKRKLTGDHHEKVYASSFRFVFSVLQAMILEERLIVR